MIHVRLLVGTYIYYSCIRYLLDLVGTAIINHQHSSIESGTAVLVLVGSYRYASTAAEEQCIGSYPIPV